MRILYLANTRLPTHKAHGVQILKACEGLALAGAEVELAAIARGRMSKDELFNFYGVQHHYGLKLFLIPNLRSLGAAGYWFESLLFAICGALRAHTYRPDCIYIRDERVAWLLVSFGFKNIMWESHDRSWDYFARIAAHRAAHIFVTSQRLREFYISQDVATSKITVVSHGIDPVEFTIEEGKEELRRELALPFGGNIVGYVGRLQTMEQDKGVEDLIKALGIITKDDPNTFLLLVGIEKTEFPLARAYAAAAHLKPANYKFIGFIAHAQVPRYLKASDLLVMNYPHTEHYAHIMSPLKLLEYMMSGTPMLTTDLPSVREVVSEESAFFVAPGDTFALARGIRMALAHSSEALMRAKAARTIAENFTWRARGERILAVMGDKSVK